MTDAPAGQKKGQARFPARALRIYRSGKRTVFSRTRLGYLRFRELFMLPACYRRFRAIKDCGRSRTGLASDLLTWFFSYNTLPTHYAKYRLWEVDRKDWKYYYASNYRASQEARLKRVVQPLEYRVLFNDKYVCGLLCQALGIPIPRTYGVLEPALDYRRQLEVWLTASSAGRLIVKPLGGRSGRNIVLAERAGNGPVIRSGIMVVPLGEFILKEKAIIQDFVAQHPDLAVFSSSSVNTLRVVTMVTPQDEIIVVNAALRTGVGRAFVDNWSAGGVAAGIDCETGRLKKHAYDKKGHRYVTHPTSGVVFEGYPIPEWERVHAAAVAIQRAFSFYRMLGLDIALDPNGQPVLIEINYGPDLTFSEQTSGPLFKMERVLRAFGEYDLLVNKHQRRLYAQLATPQTPLSKAKDR